MKMVSCHSLGFASGSYKLFLSNGLLGGSKFRMLTLKLTVGSLYVKK